MSGNVCVCVLHWNVIVEMSMVDVRKELLLVILDRAIFVGEMR